ncbi:low temperature requirement protein A [Micromonospora sp. MS34]|uniref:low temperature requirement protein A n=1 Tax=Micromonospora sp. MS34 TaxID=3385971 RepID=UPI0039A3E469
MRRTPEPNALLPREGGERATFLELFFDLVYVFALTRIGARAIENLKPGQAETWSVVTGAGKTLLLLLALWAIWQGTAWTTSRYDPHRVWLQIIVLTALAGSMVMGVAVPRAFTDTGLAFAAAYVVSQVSRPAILLVTLRSLQYRRLKQRMLITFCVTGVLWIGGALLPGVPQVTAWTVALVLEYLADRFGWPVPGLGRSTVSRWDIHGEHLAERYQQFFLVALGDTILVAGLSYSQGPYSATRTGAFAAAGVTSVLLWRIYVQRAGLILAEAVTRSRRPAAIGRSAADSHLVMVVGVVATAIGYKLVIGHPTGHGEVSWIVMILGGPALYLAGRARFEYEVFGRVSLARWVSILVLVALIPLLARAAPLVSAAAAALVLLGVAVADARRAWGRPPEPANPPF